MSESLPTALAALVSAGDQVTELLRRAVEAEASLSAAQAELATVTELLATQATVTERADRRVTELMARVETLTADLAAARSQLDPWGAPTWSDDFATFNDVRWAAENFTTYGDGNKELAVLTPRPENLRAGAGGLAITARREDPPLRPRNEPRPAEFPNGRPFSSAMIKGTAAGLRIKQGRIDVLASVPVGPGFLSCPFWLRPVDGGRGEIDVIESSTTSSKTRISLTAHDTYADASKGTKSVKAAREVDVTGSITELHLYSVRWDDKEMTWWVDDVPKHRIGADTHPWYAACFASGRAFFPRINLAVGGNWPKAPTAETPFPAVMTVKYVRAWQRG